MTLNTLVEHTYLKTLAASATLNHNKPFSIKIQIMDLSERSAEVVGFDSTWSSDRNVMVKDSGTDPMTCEKSVDNKIVGQDKKDIGVRNNILNLIINYSKILHSF